MQLEAIPSSYHCYLGEEADSHLTTTSFQVAVESDKISPEPPLLQTELPPFPQLLLIRLVLQTLHSFIPISGNTPGPQFFFLCSERPKTEHSTSRCSLIMCC